MPDYTIPSDAHSPGDPSHAIGHNQISDVLSLQARYLAQLAGTSSSVNTTNITAIQAAISGGSALTGLLPSGDTSGATDTGNAQGLINLTGCVKLAAGTFDFNSTLNPTSATYNIIEGNGWGTVCRWDGNAVSPAIGMADTTQRTVVIKNLRIANKNATTAAGTAILADYFTSQSVIDNVKIDGITKHWNIGADYGLVSTNTHYCLLANSRIQVDGTNAVGVRYGGGSTGAISNVFRNNRVLISTTDASQTGIVVATRAIELDHPDIESGAGIGIDIQSGGDACTIISPYLESNGTNVRFASGVVAPTIIGGTILTGTTADITDNGAIAPKIIGVRITGSAPYDSVVMQQSASSGKVLRIINTATGPTDATMRVETKNSGESAVGVRVTGDGASRVRLLSNSKIDFGNGTNTPDTNLYRSSAGLLKTDTALEVGTSLTVDGAASVDGTALSSPQPGDLNLLAWAWDPASNPGAGVALGAGGTATAGILNLIKIPLYGQSLSSTGVRVYLVTPGGTLTSGQNFLFLFSSAGTFLAATADQTTSWGGSAGIIDADWASGPFSVSGAFCWAAAVYNGTTGPSLLRGSNLTAAMANGKLAAASSRYGSILSSVTTSAPGNFTPSSISQKAATIWAALY